MNKKAALELDTLGKWILGIVFFTILLLLVFAIRKKMVGDESSMISTLIDFIRAR